MSGKLIMGIYCIILVVVVSGCGIVNKLKVVESNAQNNSHLYSNHPPLFQSPLQSDGEKKIGAMANSKVVQIQGKLELFDKTEKKEYKSDEISVATNSMVENTAFLKSGEIHSEVIQDGEYGQVSTITGNGTAGQGTYTVDHPRFPVSDKKGNVYFLDGDQRETKLRMWNGKRNTTIVDMATNKVTRREGEYYTAGLAVVNNNVYFALKDRAYKVIDSRVTELTKIAKWMKDNEYHYIYRMESYENDLVFMFWSKQSGGSYGFARYSLQDGAVEEILPKGYYGNPSNFELLSNAVMVSTMGGEVYYEQIFPRKSIVAVNTNEGQILDVWRGSDKTIYYSLVKDKLKPVIRSIPSGTTNRYNNSDVFVGSTQGFTDGIADEVQMYSPTDFSWDGNGYLFSDRDNNAIRKVWIDNERL